MTISDLLNAVETVIGWELPEELFADAVNAQLPVVLGSDPADRWDTTLS
jgi:hypothetical protein